MRLGAVVALALAGMIAAPVLAHHTGHQRQHGQRMSSSDVRQAQGKLAQMGYDVGPVDGKMGPKTHAALAKFQEDKGLKRTGHLDQQTLAALNTGQEGGSATSGTRGAPAPSSGEREAPTR